MSLFPFITFGKPKVVEKEIPKDFKEHIEQLTALSKSAQMTFLSMYVETLSFNMCKTLSKYTKARLSLITNKDKNDTGLPIKSKRTPGHNTNAGKEDFQRNKFAGKNANSGRRRDFGEGPESAEELAQS